MYGEIDTVHVPLYLVYRNPAKETLFLYFNPKISYTFAIGISRLSATSMYAYTDRYAILSKTNTDNQSVKN